METRDICKMLDSLLNTSKKSILIDGAWGVGKTFQVKEFIKSHNEDKKIKIIYLSLFGKKSIDEIHTQLYSQIHPTINLVKKSISLLTPATSLIPYAGQNVEKCLDFALQVIDEKTDERNKENESKKQKKDYLIIFDDLERMDKNLYFSSLLGYINQLFMSKIKVAVICNSKYIEKENKKGFDDFQEKIFDRQYKIEKAPVEIIKSYFNGYNLDSDIINNFDNNLRLAFKTSLFFAEIKKYIDDNCFDENYKHLSNKLLLWYCSLIVSQLNSKIEIQSYEKRMKKEFNIVRGTINEYFKDEDIADKIECIFYMDIDSNYEFSGKNDSILRQSVSELICSIAYAYYYDDYSCLKNILMIRCPSEEISKTYEGPNLFFLSEKHKVKYIKNIIKETCESSSGFSKKEISSVISIFAYKQLFPKKYNETKFISCVAKRLFVSKDEDVSVINYLDNVEKNAKDFFEKARKELVNIYIDEIKRQLSDKNEISDYDSFLSIIRKLREKNVYHKKQSSSISILDELENVFYENNLFLPNLKADLHEDEWNMVLSLIDFMYDLTNKDRLKQFLADKIEESNDNTEKDRLGILKRKYFQ